EAALLRRGLAPSPPRPFFSRPSACTGARISLPSENSCLVLACPQACGSQADSPDLGCSTVWFLHASA
ncbi:uncharacterized, partial [Tachysurus ichikawai]